jgi:hypothetical protein
MKNHEDFALIEPIIEKMVQQIALDNNITMLAAMDRFYHSQIYDMLTTPELYIWNFSDKAIHDMWLAEQATGNPRNSIYITGDIQNGQ